MKRFIKGKWLVLLGALIVVFIVVFLYHKGFRITYAPELETSWDAVSAVAAWAGVISSFIAIMVAVWIPKKIADRQDKIALFEKRFDCYTIIQNLLVCAKQMEDAQTNHSVQTAFKLYLGNPEKFCDNEIATVFALQLKQKETILVSGEFLFSHYDVKLLQKIISAGVELIMETAGYTPCHASNLLSPSAVQLKQEYCQLCEQYTSLYFDLMEKELQLNANK